jgi:hypothetical protein
LGCILGNIVVRLGFVGKTNSVMSDDKTESMFS